MRGFLRHLLVFAAPIAAAVALAEAVLAGSGELWSMDHVLRYQAAHPGSLYLRGIDQAFYAYKYRAILTRRPAIVVLGSSRTMKFRAPMFGAREAGAYNAGGLVNSLRDLRDLVAALPLTHTPEVVVLGVDLWWLNGRVPAALDFQSEVAKGSGRSIDEHIVGARWLLQHPVVFGRELLSIVRRSAPERIGIGARERGGGFRSDGSFKSAIAPPRSGQEWVFVDREIPPIIDRVRTGTANFPPATAIDDGRLAELESLLQQLEARGALVLGYLPPFSSETFAVLKHDPRHAQLFADFRRRVPELFERHRWPIVDASDTAKLGMDDRAMSDGFHAEETFQLRVLKAFLRDDRVSAKLPGAEAAIDRALASPATNYWEADLER